MIATLGSACVCVCPLTRRGQGCWATQSLEICEKNIVTAASSLSKHKLLLLSGPGWAGELKIIQRRQRGAHRLTISNKPWLRDEANAQRLMISSSRTVWFFGFFIPGDKEGGGSWATLCRGFHLAHTADPVTHPASKTPPKPIAGR